MFGRIFLFSLLFSLCLCKLIERGYMEPLGRYRCPPNTVLVMYEAHLPYAIYMQCWQIPVCDKTLPCSSTPTECPNTKVSGLSFMQEVNEYEKYDNLPMKGCCTYNPKPEEYQSTDCVDLQVVDILEPTGTRKVKPQREKVEQPAESEPKPRNRKPRPSDRRHQPSPKRRQPSPKRRQPSPKRRQPNQRKQQPNKPKEVQRPKATQKPRSISDEDESRKRSRNRETTARELMRLRRLLRHRNRGKRRSKRNANVVTMGFAEVALHEMLKPVTTMLVVNDIKRIKDGYKVNVCTLTCTTTTTTQPPTTPRNSQRNRERPKGPDYKDPLESPKSKPLPLPNRYRNRPKPRDAAPREINLRTFNLPSIPGLSGMAAPCFSGDSTVDTPNGPKTMNQLKSHELVKVSSVENGGPIYQPIEMWYHRIPDRQEQFIIINTTSSQKSLSLTPNHLIPLLDCQSINNFTSDELALLVEKESKFASTAKVGQCVIALKDGHFVPEPIVAVGHQMKMGIYSPITAQGSLVVDGIHVSCFTTLENHQAQHSLHEFMMKFYHLLEYITGIELGYDRKIVNIPTPMKIILDLANLILPETMF